MEDLGGVARGDEVVGQPLADGELCRVGEQLEGGGRQNQLLTTPDRWPRNPVFYDGCSWAHLHLLENNMLLHQEFCLQEVAPVQSFA